MKTAEVLAERSKKAQRVAIIGALVNIVVAVLQIIVGIAANSQALIADAIHTFSDLMTDVLAIVGSRMAYEPADEQHPYGHGRIETISSVGLGFILMLVAVGIGWFAINRLMALEALVVPAGIAVVAAALTVVAKESLYRYTVRMARRIRSRLLEANAWHHRSDAISSLFVLLGVAGAQAGFPALDAIAALVVALLISRIAWDISAQGISELIDTGLDKSRVALISESIAAVDGVRRMHMLRTRWVGTGALVDVHIQVAPRLSVSEGHQIAEAVRANLIDVVDEVDDVTVHIDPEDDQEKQPCRDLPLRSEILKQLEDRWRDLPGNDKISNITLHYLDGKVDVALVLPLGVAKGEAGASSVHQAYRKSASDLEQVGKVDVYFQ
ncbi:MAG: cation diffusion facilitator family transporter [Gammaproteobacteria bacterium]|nr:MAG: cation diffusion facilitator family transporter [Gammaproteobacteria bacterium]